MTKEKEEKMPLPTFYLLDGFSGKYVRYHWPLNDPNEVSAELILAWAKLEKFKLDIWMINVYLESDGKTMTEE